jgi:hypothetical protein
VFTKERRGKEGDALIRVASHRKTRRVRSIGLLEVDARNQAKAGGWRCRCQDSGRDRVAVFLFRGSLASHHHLTSGISKFLSVLRARVVELAYRRSGSSRSPVPAPKRCAGALGRRHAIPFKHSSWMRPNSFDITRRTLILHFDSVGPRWTLGGMLQYCVAEKWDSVCRTLHVLEIVF